jgi:hypothetical protein
MPVVHFFLAGGILHVIATSRGFFSIQFFVFMTVTMKYLSAVLCCFEGVICHARACLWLARGSSMIFVFLYDSVALLL